MSSLDVSTQSQVINLLTDLQDRLGLTYLFIAHDLSVVRHISDRIAVMYLGRIVEQGTAEEVYTRPRHPYTEALLSAIPVPDPEFQRSRARIVLRGDVPSPLAPPSGCRFRTRCQYAMDVCADEDPPVFTAPGGTTVACHLHVTGPQLAGEPVTGLPSGVRDMTVTTDATRSQEGRHHDQVDATGCLRRRIGAGARGLRKQQFELARPTSPREDGCTDHRRTEAKATPIGDRRSRPPDLDPAAATVTVNVSRVHRREDCSGSTSVRRPETAEVGGADCDLGRDQDAHGRRGWDRDGTTTVSKGPIGQAQHMCGTPDVRCFLSVGELEAGEAERADDVDLDVRAVDPPPSRLVWATSAPTHARLGMADAQAVRPRRTARRG